jgi:phosphate starvation-inducible PhoH-like protein
MQAPNRKRKTEPKAINKISLNEEQKEAKRLIIENQIVVVTGRAGSGKSLVCAQTALSFLLDKSVDKILVTRATIEVGKSLGFLPGELDNKFNPYIEAFSENLIKVYDKIKIEDFVQKEKIAGFPLQFIRGKTIEDILIVEEAQNLTKHEMLAVLTRLGKTGKIIINGDCDQTDIKNPSGEMNGLQYLLEMSKRITEIKAINLKENHRSDLVGKILDYEHGK